MQITVEQGAIRTHARGTKADNAPKGSNSASQSWRTGTGRSARHDRGPIRYCIRTMRFSTTRNARRIPALVSHHTLDQHPALCSVTRLRLPVIGTLRHPQRNTMTHAAGSKNAINESPPLDSTPIEKDERGSVGRRARVQNDGLQGCPATSG